MTEPETMKIAELERRSGTPRSTIRHYVQLGLLSRPRLLGPKLHLFDAAHLVQLKRVAELREEGLSLVQVRARLLREVVAARPEAATADAALDLRERIVRHATGLFAARGYEAVRVADIAEALRIGKATFYQHFDSKHALFVACVEGVRHTLVPKALRKRAERSAALDPLGHGRSRAEAVLLHFDAYRTLDRMLAGLAHDTDPQLAQRAWSERHAMITDAEPFLRALMDSGLCVSMDSELLAYMLWGALMGAGECLGRDGRRPVAEVLDGYTAFVERGMAAARPPTTQGAR